MVTKCNRPPNCPVYTARACHQGKVQVSERFSGKNVVVIGGNSGIGLAAARAFAQEGAKVVITGRAPQTLESAAQEIGHGAIAIRSDIGEVGQISALFAR